MYSTLQCEVCKEDIPLESEILALDENEELFCICRSCHHKLSIFYSKKRRRRNEFGHSNIRGKQEV